jgi:hypothetical protein
MRNINRERGSISVITLVVLAGLVGIAGLTVLSVRRSLGATSSQRAHIQALNAAESGLVVAGKYLRDRYAIHPQLKFTPELNSPADWNTAYGAGRQSGPVAEYPFGASRLGYDISYRNNSSDPGLLLGSGLYDTSVDTDSTVVIRVVGCTGAIEFNGTACFKAGGARVVLEVEVNAAANPLVNTCANQAQEGQNELGTGRNDCLGVVDNTVVVTTPVAP